MTLEIGNILPDATLILMTDSGPKQVSLKNRLAGRKVVIFALPGAFTPTCSVAHVPSFIRNAEKLSDKGVDEIICISVNDAFVMGEWAKATGGASAGITFLADADSSFTKSVGMAFDAAPAGLFARSKRYSMLVVDGVVKILNTETAKGVCDLTGGETMLEQLTN